MSAGQLRHEVEIQRAVRTDDTAGGHTVAWQTIPDGTVRAQVLPTSSPESFGAGQLEQQVTHKVKIRYLPDVTTGLRLLFEGRHLDIMDVVMPREIRRWLWLMCVERKAGQT